MVRRVFGSDFLPKRNNWSIGFRFVQSIFALYSDAEWREKYFDDVLELEYEAHDRLNTKKYMLKSIEYSTAFKKDLVAGLIKPWGGAAKSPAAIVVPIMDSSLAENDAARYVHGLKRNAITAPTDVKRWVVEGNKKYLECCSLMSKPATFDDFMIWKSKLKYLEAFKDVGNIDGTANLTAFRKTKKTS